MKWTNTCYGTAYGPLYACTRDFPNSNLYPTGNTKSCGGFTVSHECCTGSCRWTGCEGKLKLGQAICNWYSAGYYTGKVKHDDCGWDTDKVECCKAN